GHTPTGSQPYGGYGKPPTGSQPYGGYGQPLPGQPLPPEPSGFEAPSYSEQLEQSGGGTGYGSGYGTGSGYGEGSFEYKVGIIALRPLGFGEFFDGGFRAIQHNPQVMFGLSLIVALVTGAFQAVLVTWLLGNLASIDPTDQAAVFAGLGSLTVSMIVMLAITGLATLVLNGLLITSVSQSVLGRKVSISTVWREARGRILRLIGLTIVIGLINGAVIIAAMLAAGLLLAPLSGIGSSSAAVLAIFAAFLIFLGAVVVVLYFYTRLSIASPVLMMEKSGIGTAISRSWALTKGFAFRNLGVLLLATLISGVIVAAAAVPIGFLSGMLMQLPSSLGWLQVGLPMFLQGLLTALITPFLAAVTALLYVDLRMRKEGLDVALIRAAGTSL
ncbi:MAG: glycerophosphoryl diester phosphodiesterase membrane domain-containing protein, partial [bacterium]|nr:glycerophosphoryl diester phosphodiesterase membrane domain-containing protein [bacterium]